MKKISLLVATAMILTVLTASFSPFTSFGSYDDPISGYNSGRVISDYLEENINNYFLPAAYDISPYTIDEGVIDDDGDYWPYDSSYNNLNCQEFYDRWVVYDDRGRISQPPVYTLIVKQRHYFNMSNPVYSAYASFTVANKNGVEMTPSMWRVLHSYRNNSFYAGSSKDSPEIDRFVTQASLDSVINAYIAPWTLYDNGKLYTWPDIMAMTPVELEALDFSSYEFSKFIKNLKNELLLRGWWKAEYQSRFDYLYLHRDDYHLSQPQNEILKVDGETVYLGRVYQEFKKGIGAGGKEGNSLNSIISVNIYKKEFCDAIDSLDASVKEKYRDMLEVIYNEYSINRRDDSMIVADQYYKSYIATCAPPGYMAYSGWLGIIAKQIEVEGEISPGQMILFEKLDKTTMTDGEIKDVFEEFNYVFGETAAMNFDMVDTIMSNSKKENVDYFAYPTSVVLNYDKTLVIPWWEAAALNWEDGARPYYIERIDDYERLIERLEYLYDNYDSSRYEAGFRRNIDYLKKLSSSPDTGDGTSIYLIAGAGSLCIMTLCLFVGKKRKAI